MIRSIVLLSLLVPSLVLSEEVKLQFTLKCSLLDKTYEPIPLEYFTVNLTEKTKGDYWRASITQMGVFDFDEVKERDRLEFAQVELDKDGKLKGATILKRSFKGFDDKPINMLVTLWPTTDDAKIPNYYNQIPRSIRWTSRAARLLEQQRYLEEVDPNHVVSHVTRYDEKTGKMIAAKTSPFKCIPIDG